GGKDLKAVYEQLKTLSAHNTVSTERFSYVIMDAIKDRDDLRKQAEIIRQQDATIQELRSKYEAMVNSRRWRLLGKLDKLHKALTRSHLLKDKDSHQLE